jgi:hypothetical protein
MSSPEFGLSLCKIVRSSVILLLPLFTEKHLPRILFDFNFFSSCVGLIKQKQKLQPFLNKNRDVFATNLSEMGHTTLLKYEILTGNSPPVQCRPYRTSPKMKAEIERQLDEMLKYGIIEESVSNNRLYHPFMVLVSSGFLSDCLNLCSPHIV